MRFEEFTGRCIEVLQLEVVGATKCETETFDVELLPPENVFTEAPGASAHVSKVEEVISSDQRMLQ